MIKEIKHVQKESANKIKKKTTAAPTKKATSNNSAVLIQICLSMIVNVKSNLALAVSEADSCLFPDQIVSTE